MGRRVAGGLGLLVLFLLVAVPVTLSTFLHSERYVTVGAHDATVQPTTTGHLVIDAGAVLPRARLPAGLPGPFGLDLTLGASEVETLEELITRDAVIASQPQGEIAEITRAIRDMALAAAGRGAGAGALAVLAFVGAWRAIGRRRRHQLRDGLRGPWRPRRVVASTGLAVAVAVCVAAMLAPERGLTRPPERWQSLRAAFPQIPADPVLDRVEVADDSATRGSRALVTGAVEVYRRSVEFYGELTETARTAAIRAPADGETTALVVTDRHDNIAMDPVARVIAEVAEAELVLDLGDDTSGGASWETFSIDSLAEEFAGFDVVAITGNHDTGRIVPDLLREKGFTVLDGEPVDVAGIRFLGIGDPRSTSLVGYRDGNDWAGLAEQDDYLTEVACADSDVAVVLVHDRKSAERLAASGCVDLVLAGHLHRQVGPERIDPTTDDPPPGDPRAEVRPTTRHVTGSTGGAVLAFALGSALRRDAQVSVVTFDDGRPVGLQPVTFTPGGDIVVGVYHELPLPPDPSTDGG